MQPPNAFCWQLAGLPCTTRLLPAHHPSTLCAPPADAPQTMQHTAQHLAAPASHLPSFCAAPGGPLHSIRHLAACHPLAPAQHPSALCKPSARQFTARCPATPCKPSAIARHSILRSRAPSAGTLQAICWHEPMPLTARRTNRRRKQEP